MEKQSLKALAAELRNFADDREWDQFHSPKNLAMALAVEASEIMEHFQWLTEEQSSALPPEKLRQVREEIGDVLIYLTRLADKLGIDPLEAAAKKLEVNRAKYPADKARGIAKKYTEL
ncbi:MAG: nucleotide pyrophosphohydrolase [Deltaproteobacteria bacterium RIFOXYD12_FULL_57_12]|nr:MAG: nucleotide pyrophosphohydrolase [Deltaproteobacteria bacterium RIFOXYD12_FULL_57_12]